MTENQSTSQPSVGIVALPSLARALDAEFDAISNDQFQVAAKHVTDRLREGSFPVIVSNRGQSALLKTWTRSALRTASAVVIVAFEDGYQDFPEGASVVTAPATIRSILATINLPAPINGDDVLSHTGNVEDGNDSAIATPKAIDTSTNEGVSGLGYRDENHTLAPEVSQVAPALPSAPPLPPIAPAPVYTGPVEPDHPEAEGPRRRGAPVQVREAAVGRTDEWIYENDPLVSPRDLTTESVVGAWYVDAQGVLDEDSFTPNPGHVPVAEPVHEPVSRIPDFSAFSPNADDAQTVQIPAVPSAAPVVPDAQVQDQPIANQFTEELPAPATTGRHLGVDHFSGPAEEVAVEPVAEPVAERFGSFDESESTLLPATAPMLPAEADFSPAPEFIETTDPLETADLVEVPQVQVPEPFVPEPAAEEPAPEEFVAPEPAFVVPGIVPPSIPSIVQPAPADPALNQSGDYEGSRPGGDFAYDADEDDYAGYPEHNDDVIEATSLTASDNPLSMKPEAEYLNVRNQPHGRGDVVFSWSGKGGVGKSTVAYSLAQRAALQGKRVVLIDGNFGQGDLRQYLRLTTADIPSIYDATVSKNLKDAFIGPDVINNFRSAGLDDIRFVYVAAPPAHLADPSVVTPELYAAVIAAATHLADLVVVDTQIVETVDSTGMVDRLIAPLLSQRAWGVGVTDLSGPGLANLMRRLDSFAEEGVPASRMLTLLNRIHRDANYNAEKLQAALSKNSTFEGAIFDDHTIHNQMNLGHTVAEMPTLAPMLDHILGRIAGQQPPQVALSSGPPAQKAKRRFFGRNKS